jgi:AcrR family transcriptional regulator
MAPEPSSAPATSRGRDTRDRILEAAAQLIAERGVDGTGLDAVLAAAGAGKGQLYHYFGDKRGLVTAVIQRHEERLVSAQSGRLAEITTLAELRAWLGEVAAYQESLECRFGCPIGSIAAEVSCHDESARQALAAAFDHWHEDLTATMRRLRANGEPLVDGEPEDLALGLLATIQGGLLLAKTHVDVSRLRVILDRAAAGLDRGR